MDTIFHLLVLTTDVNRVGSLECGSFA